MKHLILTLLALSSASAFALQTSLDYKPLIATQINTNTPPSLLSNSCTETSAAEQSNSLNPDSTQTFSSVISCQSAPIPPKQNTEFMDATTQYEEKLQIVDIKQPHAIEAGDQIASR